MAHNVENCSNYYHTNKQLGVKAKPPDKTHYHTTPTNEFPPLPYTPTPPSPGLSYTCSIQREQTPTPTTHSPGKKRSCEEHDDATRSPRKGPRTPVEHSGPAPIHQILQHIQTLNSEPNQAYNTDEEMEDADNDWSEPERHFTRLSKARYLINELNEVLSAAQREKCLSFLTEDQEIKDSIAKFHALTHQENNIPQLNPIYAGIADIHRLIAQVTERIDKMAPPLDTNTHDKSINGSIHATGHGPPPRSHQASKTPQSAHPTPPKAQPQAKQEPKIPQNPKTSYHPSRLVVQFSPNGIPVDKRPDPSIIVGSINDGLDTNPKSKHIRVVAASFNTQGNLILSTRSDQTAEELLKFQNSFSHVLTNISNRQEVILREDKKWFKIQVDGVNTGSLSIGNGRVMHSADTVHQELANCNPIYTTALRHIVAKPRWLRTTEELITTPKSSLVFALTDESSARQILNQKTLAAFGRHCTLRAFQDRPPVTQCRICWRLNHTTHQCKETQRCRICSGHHEEKDHPHTNPNECHKCCTAREYGDTMDTTADGHCPHDLRCINCSSNNREDCDHPADARRCPARIEKYGTARENERRAQKNSNPWIKVKPKKTKPKTLNSPTTGITIPSSQNSFDPLSTPRVQQQIPLPPHQTPRPPNPNSLIQT